MTPTSPTQQVLHSPAPGIRGAAIVGGLATASGIALTAASGWLIVAASHQPVILTLLAVIVAVRAFGMARPAGRYVERVRSHDAALALLTRRRVAAYRALIPLTPARLGRRSRSDVLTSAVQDLEDLVFAQVRVVVPVVGAAVAASLTVAALGYLVPGAGLLLLVVALAVGATAWWASRLEERGQDGWLAARADVARVATLVATDGDRLRGCGAQEWTTGRLRCAHRDLVAATGRQVRARSVAVAAVQAVTAAGTLAAAALALWARGLGLSDAVAALVVLTPLAVGDAASTLPDAMGARARAAGGARRLRRLLEQPPAVREHGTAPQSRPISSRPAGIDAPADPGPAPQPPLGPNPDSAAVPPRLELRALEAAWTPEPQPGQAPDLPAVDLVVEPGEHVAVVGSSGSGKSTLLAVLARHLDPAAGTYLVDGVDVQTLALDRVRREIALLDDDPHVFASTARENLRLARPEATDDDLRAALDDAGLGSWLAALPDGLDTRLGASGRGVSGGERARLGLARVLVSRRPVVLLDEPVAHLDHPTATAVLADLRRTCRHRTVVMASHRPEGLAEFDRVVDLDARRG